MNPARQTSRFACRTLLSVATVAALGMLAPVEARADDVIYACYVPSSGTIYRIKVTDPNETCKAPSHIEFSWNVQGPAGQDGEDGVAGHEVVVSDPEEFPSESGASHFALCPEGKKVLGGGYQVLGLSDPAIALNRPLFTVGGWRMWVVSVGSGDAGSTGTLTVWAICASVGTG